MNPEEIEFLQESNFIEGVTDSDSLDQAVIAWEYLKQQQRMTIPVILETHKLLMKNQKLKRSEIGKFRKRPVGIYKNGIIIRVMSARSIVQLLAMWVEQMNVGLHIDFNQSYKKALSKKLHVHYEAIHPFIDGNGRTGRMFMNWWRLQVGLPILVIKEEEKQEYYKWFMTI
jgi:Fic family protein